MHVGPLGWALFIGAILILLALDLLLLNRRSHTPSFRESLAFTAFWVALAMLFAWGVWQKAGPTVASQFVTGYLLELSLSVDNLFVFLLIFAAYKVPDRLLHKVLFWGILGAIVLRMVFIGMGAALVSRFNWVLYLFGAFLIFTGVRLFFHQEEGEEAAPESWLVRQVRRFFHVTDGFDAEGSFFVRHQGKLAVTPLLLVVAVVESSDVLFAVDSIPAVFGVTKDPFVVYTSNIFAILGLRSMFFALSGLMHMFRYLKTGLSIVLVIIGLKLCFLHLVEERLGLKHVELAMLGVVVAVLASSIGLSLLRPEPLKPDRRRGPEGSD